MSRFLTYMLRLIRTTFRRFTSYELAEHSWNTIKQLVCLIVASGINLKFCSIFIFKDVVFGNSDFD